MHTLKSVKQAGLVRNVLWIEIFVQKALTARQTFDIYGNNAADNVTFTYYVAGIIEPVTVYIRSLECYTNNRIINQERCEISINTSELFMMENEIVLFYILANVYLCQQAT